MSDLALFGGRPVRERPFSSQLMVDEDEKALVSEVLERKEFSRFMGSPTPDIEKLLIMQSADAANYENQYFSFLGGRMVRRFEADFALKFDVPYAVSVNSCTSGLSAALAACGLGPGDEVITTCLSFNATAMSILLFNSIPIFVDVSPDDFCLDPEAVERSVTERTKAILAVHLLGFPANLDALKDIAKNHGLFLIEDCAQAPGTLWKGRPVGTVGDFGVFSFQETKNIMTGEGGMMLTSRPDLARRARLIRNHGESVPDASWADADLVNLVGLNFRMTELIAALGVAQLKKLDENNRIRQENTARLCDGLKGIATLGLPQFVSDVTPHVVPFVYRRVHGAPHRDIVLQALRAEGIPVGPGYQRLMSDNPVFQRGIAFGNRGCPWSCRFYSGKPSYDRACFPEATDLLENRFIWFYHIGPPITSRDMDDVVEAFRKVFDHLDDLSDVDSSGKALSYKW